jgi:hypothetical protein
VAAVVFDTGALIAIDRGERRIGAVLAAAARDGVEVVTSSACVAQAWRDPARQARLQRALRGFAEQPFDARRARHCGALLARTGTSDIADAAIALLANGGDSLLTSDPGDIGVLLDAIGVSVDLHCV